MLRIVGGTLGGRRISAPPGRNTRPTSGQTREGIFNALASLAVLEGSHVLDLFAGSGALGIEALSRGAESATFVESHARTAALIRANLRQLNLPSRQARIVKSKVETWLNQPPPGAPPGDPPGRLPGGPASVALLDPPYAYPDYGALLVSLARTPRLSGDAVIVLETGRRDAGIQALAPPALPAGLEPLRSKRYGDTLIWFFRKVVPSFHDPASPDGPP